MYFDRYYAFGDSITEGFGLAEPEESYASQIGSFVGLDPTIDAIPGSQAADLMNRVIGRFIVETGTKTLTTVQIGTNDSWVYRGHPNKQVNFERIHLALLAYLSIPDRCKIFAQDPTVTYTGDWETSLLYGGNLSKRSRSVGASGYFEVDGETIFVAYTVNDEAYAAFNVIIDGMSRSVIETKGYGSAPVATYLGASSSSSLLRVSGLGPGRHVVQVEVMRSWGDQGWVTVDWVASPDSVPSTGSVLVVGGVPQNKEALYSIAYTEIIKKNVHLLRQDGLSVVFADTNRVFDREMSCDQEGDLLIGEAHPSKQGHRKIAAAFEGQISGFLKHEAARPGRAPPSMTIFRNDTHCVEYFPSPQRKDRLAFIFSAATNRRLDGNIHGGDVLVRNGYDVIAFKSICDDWFQRMPPEALRSVQAFCAEKDYTARVAYGISAGGYAALALASRLSCDRVIAIAPQYSIREDFDTRWASFANLEWNYSIDGRAIPKGCEITLVFDPHGPDGIHATEIGKVASSSGATMKTIELHYAGHDIGPLLYDCGVLKAVIIAILDDFPSGDVLQKSLNGFKKSSIYYIHSLVGVLRSRGRRDLMRRMIDRGQSMDPNFSRSFGIVRE